MDELDYLSINKKLWDAKTDIHWKSDFYNVEEFLETKNVLNEIELNLLGDIRGKSILHLQCHFGQDSLSLSHLGAKVTGLDISTKSIERARQLNDQLGFDATFVESDVYSAKEVIDEKFDIVFTSYGTIGWLPDMNKWAEIVEHFVKPGGRFVFVELHPFVWMHDENFERIDYSYFNKEVIVEKSEGTYAAQDSEICETEIGWNHPLGEVIGSLLKTGMRLHHFEEFNYSPHKCFKGMEAIGEKKYIISKFGEKAPLTYALSMTKLA